MSFCRDLARRRLAQGFTAAEVVSAMRCLECACHRTIIPAPENLELQAAFHDYVTMTVEFGVDRILETYEEVDTGM